jgi:hypothetical protein
VQTVGNKQEGNLRPEWADRMIPCVSMVAHEYNYEEGWCICECWVSDHPIRGTPRNMDDLQALASDESVIEVLTEHPLSPEVLGILSLSGEHSPESVDLEKKTLVFKGKTMSFKRVEKHRTTAGIEESHYILDEG